MLIGFYQSHASDSGDGAFIIMCTNNANNFRIFFFDFLSPPPSMSYTVLPHTSVRFMPNPKQQQ